MDEDCFAVDVINEVVEEAIPYILTKDPLEACLAHYGHDEYDMGQTIAEVNLVLNSAPPTWQAKFEPLPALAHEPTPPSIEAPPKLELKPLPANLNGYTVYYKYPRHDQVQSYGNLPPNCSVIELPAVSELRNRNGSDVFSVLASEFSIKFHVSKECLECCRKGGRRDHDGQHFSCKKEKEAQAIRICKVNYFELIDVILLDIGRRTELDIDTRDRQTMLSLVMSSHVVRVTGAKGSTTAHKQLPDRESFNCGTHGQIKFPLSNTTFSQCGLFIVQNCRDLVPKLNLGVQGLLYDLNSTNVQQNSTLNFFHNIPWYHLVQVLHDNSISPELDKQQGSYFHGNDSYRSCRGYTVYYKYPHHYPVQSNGSFPPNCSVIELPVVSKPPGNRNASDLFSVLASEFSIEFHVSNACRECRRKRGRCDRDGLDHFLCKKEKGISKLILILGTENGMFHRTSIRRTLPLISYQKLTLKEVVPTFGACVFSYAELEQTTHDFDPSKVLGDGGFGTIYHGKKGHCSDYYLQHHQDCVGSRTYEGN
ncbi:hypothetical protein Vadar_003496 [Vaccinium darrowii]|uniref:Uncharacterized protein n=1 Tax=Vaccinium darrowii TaxID=229202 RepID=A0ACB7XG93_9ERIC|nr:hypothetical protein Vadar_003496 [Vaccinium darrowii]